MGILITAAIGIIAGMVIGFVVGVVYAQNHTFPEE